MTLKRAIAIRINNLMEEHAVKSRYELCKKSGMPESTLRNIINEAYKTINILTLIKICDGLGVTIQEFFNSKLFDRDNLDID